MKEKIKAAFEKDYTIDDLLRPFKRLINKIGISGFQSLSFLILLLWGLMHFFSVINNLYQLKYILFHIIYLGFINSFYNLTIERFANYTIAFLVLMIIVCIYFKKASIKAFFKEVVAHRKWELAFLILFIWTFISAVLSNNYADAFLGSAIGNDSFYSYCYYACIYITATLCLKERHRNIYLKVFAWVSTLISFIVVVEDLGEEHILYAFQIEKAAVFYNSNPCGYFINMGILCAVGLLLYERRRSRRLLYGMVAAFNIYGLIVNDTFGSFLGTVFGIIFATVIYFLHGNANKIRAAFPIIILIFTMIISSVNLIPRSNPKSILINFSILSSDVSDIIDDPENAQMAGTDRMGIWLECLELIKEKPLFGYGPEQMPSLSEDYLNESAGGRPHNEYIQHALFFGIPGLIYYLAALFILAAYKLKNIKSLKESELVSAGCVFAYLVSAFFGNTFAYTVIYLFIFLGLLAPRGEIVPDNEDDFPTKLTKKINKLLAKNKKH